MRVVRNNAFWSIVPFFCILGLILYLFFPPRPFDSLDTVPNALLPLSLLREGNFDFNEFIQGSERLEEEKFYPSIKHYYFYINNSGRVVANFPVFPGIAATPVYFLYSLLNPSLLQASSANDSSVVDAAYFTSILFTIGSAVLMYFVFRDFLASHILSLLGSTLFVFGTEIISTSSRYLYQHTVALFFIPLLVLAYRRKCLFWLILGVIFTMLARPPALVIGLPFLALMIISQSRMSQRARHQWMLRYRWEIVGSVILIMGVTFFLAWYSRVYMDGLHLFAPQYRIQRFNTWIIEGLTGILLSPGRGLFVYSPMFVLAVMELWRRRKMDAGIYGLSVLLYCLVMSLWAMWWGGSSHGYRMLLEIVPILMIFVMLYVKKIRARTWAWYITIVTIALSVLFQSLFGAHYYECGHNDSVDKTDTTSRKETMRYLWSIRSELYSCFSRIHYFQMPGVRESL